MPLRASRTRARGAQEGVDTVRRVAAVAHLLLPDRIALREQFGESSRVSIRFFIAWIENWERRARVSASSAIASSNRSTSQVRGEQAEVGGLTGVDHPAGQQQVLRRSVSDQVDQATDRRQGVDDAEFGRGDREPGAVGRQAEVAGTGDLPAAADAEAVDGGDHRFAAVRHGLLGDGGEAAVVIGQDLVQVADVGTGGEVLPGATDDDHLDGGPVLQFTDQGRELAPHRAGDGIAHPWVVDPDGGAVPCVSMVSLPSVIPAPGGSFGRRMLTGRLDDRNAGRPVVVGVLSERLA